MKISTNFNRFIFGVVLSDIRNADILKFADFQWKFRPRQITKESMRELFKHLDLDYPRDEESKPLSYTNLDSKQMSSHVAWIEKIANESGYEMQHIAEEWQRILLQAGIEK